MCHMLTMGDGHKVFDACGGATVTCIGQGNEEVIAAAVEQMNKITYAHPLAYTTSAAEDLAKSFLGGNTWGLQKMFLVGSGKLVSLHTRNEDWNIDTTETTHIHRPELSDAQY